MFYRQNRSDSERAMMPRPAARTPFIAALALVLAFGVLAPSVHAQQSEPGLPAQGADIRQEHIKAFAQASLSLDALNDKWTSRIIEAEQAGDADQLQAMRSRATAEIVEAIEREGLTVATYNAIYSAAQADPEVADLIQRYRHELR